MTQEKWIDALIPKLTLEDIPENYRQIAEEIGIDAAVKLSRKFGGLSLYILQIEAVLRKKRDDMIRKEFNGRNYRHLASKYGLTEVWVRGIVDKKPSNPPELLF